MAKLYTTGKTYAPKVPYQKPGVGSRVLRAPDRRDPPQIKLTLRKLEEE